MTATRARPKPAVTTIEDVVASAPGPTGTVPEIGVEAALAVVNLVAIIGVARLFTEPGPALRGAMAGLAVHVVLAVCRRRGTPAPTRIVIVLGGGLVAGTWLALGAHLHSGVPTVSTLGAAGRELSRAFDTFTSEVAPVPPSTGLALVMVLAGWYLSAMAHWAAFGLRARFEAVMPATTLFVLASVLGPDRHRLGASVAFAVAVGAFLAAHHLDAGHRRLSWFAGATDAGRRAVSRRVWTMIAAAAGTAAVAAPLLPGLDGSALLPWRDSGQDSGRVTISPLVDIRGRLVSQSNLEVFTVAADRPAYWRLTALDEFDGRIWSSVASYRGVSGELPTQQHGPAVVSVQTYDIRALSAIWLPAAYQAVAISAADGDVRWDPSSSTLLTESVTSDGQTYEVTSEVPDLTPAVLAAATVGHGDEDARWLALPDGWSPGASMLAARVTEGASSAYDAALRLQSFFRENFRYSLDVPPGHDSSSVERFLFSSRVGYCEQFAGTFAALARSIGLPSRVAVGFTPGVRGEDGRYHVRGEHAHAWPEVRFEDVGWVAFEPTPGRGAPGAEAYTGVSAQQAASGDPTTATTSPTPTPTTAAGGSGGGGTDSTLPPTTAAPSTGNGSGGDSRGGLRVVARALVLALLALALSLIAGAVVTHRRRQLRWAAATSPAGQVATAWDDAHDALVQAGLGARRGETTVAFAVRVAPQLADDHLIDLAQLVEWSAFGPSDPGVEVADRAMSDSRAVRSRIREQARTALRLRLVLDPRTVGGTPAQESSRRKRSRMR